MPESKGRAQGGGGGGCPWGTWKLRKGDSRIAIPALFTITEEEEGQRWRDASKRKKKGMDRRDRGILKKESTVNLHILLLCAV